MVLLTLPEAFTYVLNHGSYSKEDLFKFSPHGPDGIRTPLVALERLIRSACGDNALDSQLHGPFWGDQKNTCYVLIWVSKTQKAIQDILRELQHFKPISATFANYDWSQKKWLEVGTRKETSHQPFWEMPS